MTQMQTPRLAVEVAARAAADDAVASIADAVAVGAAMWATCPHSARHTERTPTSCWADRGCPVQAATCQRRQRPGWAKSGAAMWVSSADMRSASAAFG